MRLRQLPVRRTQAHKWSTSPLRHAAMLTVRAVAGYGACDPHRQDHQRPPWQCHAGGCGRQRQAVFGQVRQCCPAAAHAPDSPPVNTSILPSAQQCSRMRVAACEHAKLPYPVPGHTVSAVDDSFHSGFWCPGLRPSSATTRSSRSRCGAATAWSTSRPTCCSCTAGLERGTR